VEIEAELHAVLVDFPGKVVEDLVVAVETMAWNTAGRAELRHATYEDIRQALVIEPPLHSEERVASHRPIELGLKFWSAGKNLQQTGSSRSAVH